MLNLFSLGRTALGIAPESVKEGITNAISSNKNIQKLKKNEVFQASKNWLDNTSQKANNFIKETAKTVRYGKLFSDEKEAYQKMKNDGIDDNEAFDLIKKRRQAMAQFYGSDSKLTKTESDALKKMRADGIGSEDAFKGLMEYRSGFDNRATQIAHENQQAKQKAWDKHYEEMPWYKKAGYHAWMTGVGIGEGALKTGINTADFILGGTETGQQMREGTEMWNNNPMMNGTARGVGNFLGEAAVMGGAATVGGAALGATKTGAALGINGVMTPASTWGGMALQGAVAGAGYGAWGEVANKGSEATAESIGKQALIGGAIGGVATPIIGKVIAPAVESAIKGTAKVGNAGVQAFNHTTGSLDDRVASALAAIRKSTGRSMDHAGKNIANTMMSAKESMIRKILGERSDDIITNVSDDVGRATQKMGKIQKIRNDMAGLDEQDLQILKNTTTEEFDDWINYAKNAVDDNYAQTPYHRGAKKANEAMEMLEENLRLNQAKRMEIIEKSGTKQISLDDVRPKVMEDLKKTFNIDGWKYGKKGEVIPQVTAGRKSMIDLGNTRDMQALKMLDEALQGGSPAEMMDTIKILQNHLYDNSTGLRVSDPMKKFLERTTGKMNGAFKNAMGENYTKILSEMSDDIKLEQELKRIFKPSDLSEVTNRGELAMKRLSNGTTTSGEVRDLALKIQERTGVDLIKESRLAQLSMDIAGDIRGANLFGLVQDVKNDGIVKGALKSAGKIFADKESVARANTIRNIIGVPKDVKISGLNNAILSTKFSNNDTAMIKKIAEKISQNKPLTEIQTKNLITIKKLIEEKLPQSEVGKFRQFLPNKDIGKGLTSINKKEPIVAMNVSNKNNIKTPFTHTTPIKNTLTEVEQKYFNAIKNIKTKKNSEQIEVAEVPEFLGVNNDKIRPLYFTKSILHKITNGHGSFSGKNFIINANSWEYAIKYNDNGIDKIGLIKTIPNSNNIFVIHAERTNGYFTLTNYEPNTHFDVMKEFAKGQIYNRNGEVIKQKDLQFSQK